jgi:hypothetical protein
MYIEQVIQIHVRKYVCRGMLVSLCVCECDCVFIQLCRYFKCVCYYKPNIYMKDDQCGTIQICAGLRNTGRDDEALRAPIVHHALGDALAPCYEPC